MQLTLLKRRGLALAGLTLVAVLVAACGSSAKSGSSSSHDSLSVTKGSAGTYLVGAKGRSIYLWVADAKDKSHCSSSCLAVWPAVTASGKPTFGSGVDAKDVGTITTAGQKQLTYDGHPLYYYAPDASAGETSGQGSDSFGAKWWLVSPTGQAITGHAGSTAKATSSSSSGGGY